jgi:hypothetical protein
MTRLAIFGGEPIRKNSFARWPQFDEREKVALIEALESGVWGGYSYNSPIGRQWGTSTDTPMVR